MGCHGENTMATSSPVCPEALRTASTVLVFDSPFSQPDTSVCPSLCQCGTSETVNVLSVLLTESPREYLWSWDRAVEERPDRLDIVQVDPGSAPGTPADAAAVVERIGSPSDLTGLGVAITSWLSDQTDDAEIAVCFDSVTSLLQYVDLDRVSRFLRELANQFDAVDATAHVHVDPKAHDRQTIGTLVSLFDDVLEPDDWQTAQSA